MNSQPKLTLNTIKQSPKMARQARAADFLTKGDLDKLRQVNYRGKLGKKQFDDIDAYVAEIIARFGYDAYQAWNRGEIEAEKMSRMLAAERARERSAWLPIEAIVSNMVGSCIKVEKGQKKPQGPKKAQDIIKAELRAARGEG